MSLHQARKVFVTGPGGNRLACRILGAHHHRTVVLTSGIGCGPVFMTAIAEELARDHRVVYWDYRSHGESDLAPPTGGYSIAEHADDLDKIVRAFVPSDQKPIMIGFSMGVQVTIEWSRICPDRAGAYVFMLGVPRNPMHRTVLLRSRAAWLAERIGKYGRPVLRRVQPLVNGALRTPLTYEAAKRFGFIARDCPRDEFLDFVHYATSVPLDAYLRCAGGILDHDATDTFLRISQPVFMLAAEDDVLIRAEDARRFADKLPQARFEQLSFASHAGSIEYGTYFAGATRRFLRRLALDQKLRAA
ncbi:MAG TPA: alpha/beta hydrolase [Polyangiaceae bacterium]|nr:MAG: short chain dehydrogenase [Deltaproteobacteria bacterium ADurb.Bin207]HNT00146.1 alpha/beta hydrolase [Polyangiaceae bacterium]HNZ21259.1 alpha/beta hydrolase [Polyangiaceae bacterium]HOD21055.1 alpha/beta hydrolase [Polyangiaceae bacterium]HOE48647.1 alpha/beta hydrolase [Polyangiaceae bacterium]